MKSLAISPSLFGMGGQPWLIITFLYHRLEAIVSVSRSRGRKIEGRLFEMMRTLFSRPATCRHDMRVTYCKACVGGRPAVELESGIEKLGIEIEG